MMNMRFGVALVVGLTTAAGCVYEECPVADARVAVEPAYVRVATAPPPLQVRTEVIPPRPMVQSVWVSGSWVWQGGGWVWVNGHWDIPQAGHVWQPPVVVQVGGEYRYHPGYWRPQRQA